MRAHTHTHTHTHRRTHTHTHTLARARAGKQLGPAVLFFGCRHSAHDFLYKQELEEHLAQGDISQLHVAFSRQGPSKDYVQVGRV